jgi:hypothetical protein
MIQVSPQIKLKEFARAGRVFRPVRVVVTGMRIVTEFRSDDGNILWKDFPASHGLYGPCIYDPATKKIESLPGLEWWSDPMQKLFATPRAKQPRIEIHRRRDCKSWILLNTLDTIFGHSFLILLNASYYLRKFPDHGLIVVTTSELMRYVPKDVAEIWEVKIPPKETDQWVEPLAQLFQERCKGSEVHIAAGVSHPDPSRYHLADFGIRPSSGPDNTTEPRIVFVYRGSRLWGGDWKSERMRLGRLGEWLRKFWPQCELKIFGHAALPENVPGWEDGTNRSEADYDSRLIQALAQADLVFGAHGSSMLLPSAISRLVLEFVPLDKQPSLLQDFIFDESNLNMRQQIWRRRFLYGNSTLNDISPRGVAQLINSMISMQAQFDFYQSREGSDPLRDAETIEREYAAEIAPRVEAWHGRMRQTLDLPLSARFWQFLRKIAAERD